MSKAIKNLVPGDRFTLGGKPTVYVATGVRAGTAMTTVRYVLADSEWRHEFEFCKASLTDATLV